MKTRILAIGDTANNIVVLRKYVKNSTIHLINFPRVGPASYTYADDVEFFDSIRVSDQVEKVNEIKKNFDICITTSWEGARVAFLANLNYIMYFVGGDIRTAPFVKNARVSYLKEPVHSKNFVERWFLRQVFDNAIACVTYGGEKDDTMYYLKKYRKDAIRIDRIAVDTEIFNEKVKPINRSKTKFTFLSPQRQGLEKGMDVIWKAIPMCKSDFEVLQVNWFDQRNAEEKKIVREFLEKKPQQIELIPLLKREDMARYYVFADAILGQMRFGRNGGIEREAVFCGRPVVHYSNPNITYLIDGHEIVAPYLPHSNDPEEVAKVIDRVVQEKEFRAKLYEEEREFVNKLSDPHKVAAEWDNLFETIHSRCKTIERNTPHFKIEILNLISKMAERLLYEKRWKNKKAPVLQPNDFPKTTK